MAARQHTLDHKICEALEHMLKQQGKRVNGGIEFDGAKMFIRQEGQQFLMRAKDERGVIFEGSRLKSQRSQLNKQEIKNFLNYQKRIALKQGIPRNPNRGLTR